MESIANSSLLLLTVLIGASGCNNSKEASEGRHQMPPKVTVKKISMGMETYRLNYSGVIEPDNTAHIGFAVPGVVNAVYVNEGQFVKEGQLLASIDDTEFKDALAITEAGLEQAEDMYRRLSSLYEKGSLPEKDYIEIKTTLAQAKANKSINAKRIADSKLHASISGIISSRSIEKGSSAAPGAPAFSIVKLDRVYARISVPESEIGSLKTGREADVTVPTLGQRFKGKIAIINPQADAISRSYTVKIQLSNADGALLPGMLTNIDINTDKSIAALRIPATSVVRDADDLTYVFVVGKNNRALRKRITASGVAGENEIIVTQGLEAGEELIVAGHTQLKDGSEITF